MDIIPPFCNKAVDYRKRSSVGVHGAQSLISSVIFYRSLCVLLSIFAHLATKGQVSFCHHLASIVYPLLALNMLIFSEFA